MLSAAPLVWTALLFAQAEPPAARSGEARLREVLRSISSQGPVIFTVNRSDRATADSAPEYDGILWAHWSRPDLCRLQYQSIWGDAFLLVRAEGSVFYDLLGEQAQATLTRQSSSFIAGWNSIRGTDRSGAIPILLTGEDAVMSLAGDSGPIAVQDYGLRRLRFTMSGGSFGDVTLVVRQEPGGWVPESMERARRITRGGQSIVAGAALETVGSWRRTPLSAELFRLKGAPGVEVIDRRSSEPAEEPGQVFSDLPAGP